MLGEEIRKYRMDNGLTLDQMAKKCGVSKPTICFAENGKKKTTALVEAKIRKVIGGK